VNWSIYNQSLVKRGEILLGFDIINNWDTELKEMSQGKIGKAISLSKHISSFTWIR